MGLAIKEAQDFFDLNVPILMMNYLATERAMWQNIAGQMETERYNSEMSMLSGLSMASQTPLYDGPGELKPVQGYEVSQTQKKWSFDVTLPEATYRFANNGPEMISTFEASGGGAAMARPINLRIDNLVAAHYISAESTTGPDAVYYASASHPRPNSSSVWSNLYSGGLTQSNLLALMAQIDDCPDLVGEPAELLANHTFKLLVSPTKREAANVILKTMAKPGTPNNDINAVQESPGLSMDPLVWTRLSTSFDGSDANDAWLVVPGMASKVVWNSRPQFKSIRTRNDDLIFTGKAWFDVIFAEPRGLWMLNDS